MRLGLFCAAAGLLLGSASPPPTMLPYEKLASLDTAAVAPPPLDRQPQLQAAPPAAAPARAAPPPAPAAPVAPAPALAAAKPPPEPSRPAKRSRSSGVRVVVSLPLQRAYVFDDGELVATSPVSTGKRGHETPTGTFPITQKKVKHRSNKYANAPMPYMQRLTSYGIALHAGALPGYPASHGCIRLPRSFAKKLYGMTRHGTPVTVTKKRFKSAKDALSVA